MSGGQKQKLRLGIMLSGGGRTMLNIDRHIRDGYINAEIAVVISSRSMVAGVDRARKIGFEPVIIRKKDYDDIDSFSKKIVKTLDAANVNLVLQCGWLCLWKLPENYRNKVMNIHPSLLPCFGGKGLWGNRVHQAVLDAGCKVSGCTVHFVTNEYDAGPIIIQKVCPVCDTDTADVLSERVFELECQAYPQAVKLYQQGSLTVRDGKVIIRK